MNNQSMYEFDLFIEFIVEFLFFLLLLKPRLSQLTQVLAVLYFFEEELKFETVEDLSVEVGGIVVFGELLAEG